MNKNFKKLMALLLSSSFVFASVINISANAEADTVNYVAFGDSISSGYGLDIPQDCCVNLVGDYLKSDAFNFSVDGLTSSGLVDMLENGLYDEDISNADVITLTIGSNDILQPFLNIVSETLNIEGDITTGIQEWYATSDILQKAAAINKLAQVLPNNEEINLACENFKNITFPTIISDIQELNPDCEIVVTNFYNPFYDINLAGMLDLGSITDTYIQELNSALDTSSTDYAVANIYDDFNSTGLTNIDVATFNLDVHPNVQGHKVIADAIIENITTEPSHNIGESEVFGDVNKDGKTNVVDLLVLKKYLLGLLNPETESAYNFDVNGDSSIGSNDLLILKRYLLGLL